MAVEAVLLDHGPWRFVVAGLRCDEQHAAEYGNNAQGRYLQAAFH
jgi:hypothetical protein